MMENTPSETVEGNFTQEISRHYLLHVPPGDGPLPLLIAMHGYAGEMRGAMRMARAIEDRRWAVASLQGPYPHLVQPKDRSGPLGYGFGWVTNFDPAEGIALHVDAITRLVDRLAAEGTVDPARVFLLGFSQSVAISLRVAFMCPGGVRGVIGLCGGIPGDWARSEEYHAADVDVLLVGGTRDPGYPPDMMERNAEALRGRARSVELLLQDIGHEYPRAANPAIAAWIAARI